MSFRCLAFDIGAESGRAMLATIDHGKLRLDELHRFANVPVQLPTGLYWNTLQLFEEMLEGLRCASRLGARLDAIGIDTWGVDFGLLGRDGALIENPRHYRDQRTHGVPEKVFEIVPREEIFRETGIQFMDLNSLYQLFAIRRGSPWLLEDAETLLFMPDLFNYFLTGVKRSEATFASTSQFYNPVRKCFATEMLERLGIPAHFLPELVDPGMCLGPLRAEIAEECGLDPATPVYTTASHDTAAAVAAVPAQGDAGWCYISSGTWSLMGVELDRPLIDEASLAANFTNEAGAGGTIRFLKNIPGLWVLQECRRVWAKEGREYSYAQLMEMAEAAAAADTVLDLDQFVSPGHHPERIREHCRMTGQRAPAGDGEMCRTILYSLAVRYQQVLHMLEDLTGRTISVIHIVGGGSRNEFLNRLTAEVTGRRVVAGPVEATAAGNALVQAIGAGAVGSLEEARAIVREM
jgi:rhamnulokinase